MEGNAEKPIFLQYLLFNPAKSIKTCRVLLCMLLYMEKLTNLILYHTFILFLGVFFLAGRSFLNVYLRENNTFSDNLHASRRTS